MLDYKLTFDEVTARLGTPAKIEGGHAYWRCPDCADESEDNLMFTFSNRLLKSWCCDSCKRIYGTIMAERGSHYKSGIIRPNEIIRKKPEHDLEKLKYNKNYLEVCRNEPVKSFDDLEKQRGIEHIPTILDMRIGYDRFKDEYVFPIVDIELPDEIIGFEYRKRDGSRYIDPDTGKDRGKLRHSKGAYSCLASVYKGDEGKNLIIMEGFIDAYLMYQHLFEEWVSKEYDIITASNGVGNLPGLLREFSMVQYSRVILYLDKDKPKWNPALKRYVSPGVDAMKTITAEYPFVEAVKMDCNCKDFGQHYNTCMKENKDAVQTTETT